MVLASLALLALGSAQASPEFAAPAGSRYAEIRPGEYSILPNGRIVSPTGRRLYANADLWQVLVGPDGTVVGMDPSGLSVYDLDDPKPERLFVAMEELAPGGAFYTLDQGLFLAVCLGEDGALAILDGRTFQTVATINTNVDGVERAYLNDVVVDPKRALAYAVDIANQHLLTFDLKTNTLIHRVPAGREPYTLALSDDGSRLFVANIGLFDYSVVGRPDEPGFRDEGLLSPAFGYPSREAIEGVRHEGRDIPGLGDPHHPGGQSVFAYDLAEPKAPKFVEGAKTGELIRATAEAGKAVGGSAPNELACHEGKLYVSNANNDTVQVFDQATLKSLDTIPLSPLSGFPRLRGVIPAGLVVDAERNRLYVCEAGLNALAVIDLDTLEVVGHIPTGWFPVQAELSADGETLYVATQKGIGRGPRGELSLRPADDERFGFPEMPGMIDVLAVPSDEALDKHTQTVLANNGLLPVTRRPSPVLGALNEPSPLIEYVVFITKENHTFDGIFGDLPGAKGEPEYAELGLNGWIREQGKDVRLPVMVNHHALARQFAISDNFYMEPQASGDGHRWLVGVYPSLWSSRNFYWGWRFIPNDQTKGRLVTMGSNGSQIPEDYLENGSMWEHLERRSISFRNYGEGYELPGTLEPWPWGRSGTMYLINHPMPISLFENTDFDFPAYNTDIPDIARADWFIQDLEEQLEQGKPFPKFINIAICNDHGAGAKPEYGYPYWSSYMADNDLALGRIVEYLSHRPEWKKMAIFVTQDDSGGDSDHVDRHRSFVLAISPFSKRGYVSHEHTSIMSMIKTMYSIFGLGPNNMFDLLATDLGDMLQPEPDFTPYVHRMTDRRIFKEEETFDPTDPNFERRRRRGPSVKMDDQEFVEDNALHPGVYGRRK